MAMELAKAVPFGDVNDRLIPLRVRAPKPPKTECEEAFSGLNSKLI